MLKNKNNFLKSKIFKSVGGSITEIQVQEGKKII